MDSCIELCRVLQKKYNLASHNILGHSDIAVDRKWDPGIFFDWNLLQKNKIGIEFKTSSDLEKNEIIFTKGDSGEEVLSLQKQLSKLGYKIDLTGIFDEQTNCVIRAFQAHFVQESIHEKGGIEYFHNLNSVFEWDQNSKIILDKITTCLK